MPEMLKAGKDNKLFVQMIQDLMKSVWEERAVPKEWVDAVIVPIPKRVICTVVITGVRLLYWKL